MRPSLSTPVTSTLALRALLLALLLPVDSCDSGADSDDDGSMGTATLAPGLYSSTATLDVVR